MAARIRCAKPVRLLTISDPLPARLHLLRLVLVRLLRLKSPVSAKVRELYPKTQQSRSPRTVDDTPRTWTGVLEDLLNLTLATDSSECPAIQILKNGDRLNATANRIRSCARKEGVMVLRTVFVSQAK
jgi:hypothetical protein